MQIISIEDAKAQSLRRYFTGAPCLNGHVAERRTSTHGCVECERVRKAAWRLENSEAIKASASAYRKKTKEQARALSREWAKANPDRVLATARRYREKNREKMLERTNAWRNRVRRSDAKFNLAERVRCAINASFRDGGFTKRSKTGAILGCSWPEFAAHIERQFLPGMSWENRSKWHIDHIVPMATAVTEADVLALNHFTNLRPLWAEDNLAKKAKITHLI